MWFLLSNTYALLKLYLPKAFPRLLGDSKRTALLTTGGRIERRLSSFGGSAGEVVEFWGTAPAIMPIGLTMGTTVLRSRLYVAIRYRRALFSDRAATSFGELFLENLMRLTRGPT
jgi:hypothetical protein